jgi:hypothetical protein
MIYQTKSTEFGEFCSFFFENLNFGQILFENLTEKHQNSRISPISLRTGKKPKPKSKSLLTSRSGRRGQQAPVRRRGEKPQSWEVKRGGALHGRRESGSVAASASRSRGRRQDQCRGLGVGERWHRGRIELVERLRLRLGRFGLPSVAGP